MSKSSEAKPRFSLGSKIMYGILVVFILLMFWPSSREFLQRGLLKTNLFKPKVEQKANTRVQTEHQPLKSTDHASFFDEDGEVLMTQSLKGKVVFINFWATWCGPCVAEMPSIQQLYDQFGDREDMVFLLVDVDGELEGAQEFMKEHDLRMPIYTPASNIPQNWLNGAIPSTVVLDKSGECVFEHKGMANYADPAFVQFIASELNK